MSVPASSWYARPLAARPVLTYVQVPSAYFEAFASIGDDLVSREEREGGGWRTEDGGGGGDIMATG